MTDPVISAKIANAVFPVTIQMDPVIAVKVSEKSVSAVLSTTPISIPVSIVGTNNQTIVLPDPELESRVDEIEDELGNTDTDFAAYFNSLIV